MIYLTGCYRKIEIYSFSLPIKDIKLGMTIDEVSKNLNVTDVTLNKSDNNSHYNYIKIDNISVLDKESTLTLLFFDYKSGELKDRLYSIMVDFNNVDVKDLIKQLTDKYGDYDNYEEEDTSLYTWQKPKLSSLDNEMIDKVKEFESSGYDNLTKEQIQYVDNAYKSAKDTPIGSVRFFVDKKSGEIKLNATLVIEGKYSVIADLVNENKK